MPFWFHPKRYVYSTANSRDLSRCDDLIISLKSPWVAEGGEEAMHRGLRVELVYRF